MSQLQNSVLSYRKLRFIRLAERVVINTVRSVKYQRILTQILTERRQNLHENGSLNSLVRSRIPRTASQKAELESQEIQALPLSIPMIKLYIVRYRGGINTRARVQESRISQQQPTSRRTFKRNVLNYRRPQNFHSTFLEKETSVASYTVPNTPTPKRTTHHNLVRIQ